MLPGRKFGAETAAALVGTAFSLVLLVSTAMYAGPLWRDETNSINMVQLASLKELWGNLSFESFPPFWLLILRGFSWLGLTNGDAGIRMVGLYVGVCFLVSLWLCSRWMGGRAPTLSVALLGSLPVFIFIVGANRAYGLASCLLVLSFGMLWRIVENPSRWRVLGTGLIGILFAQCVYYDVVFLGAMLVGAALVVIRRRQWRTLGALVGIGAAAGASMAIYLPVIHRGSAYVPMNQEPSFSPLLLWYKFGDAVTAKSSARPSTYDGPEVWLWVALLLVGAVVALMMQLKRKPQAPDRETRTIRNRSDLALYCIVSMVLGIVGFLAFLVKLRYLTQSWYYVEMLCLCTISLDGVLGATLPKLRPWGLLRIGLLVVMMSWCARSGWEEAHTRRSNVDLLATILDQKAKAGDLIVVQGAWEGITFDRYYTGQARWVTVPPITSHKVHRNDLAAEQMNKPDPMAPVLNEITDTLRGSNNVWTVGNLSVTRPEKLLPPSGLPVGQWVPHLNYWNAQVTAQLRDHAVQEQVLEMSPAGPINRLENLPVLKFSGYKADTN
ncbi:MAG: hypothetical protein P4N60_16350 [Verrucomicrobiae bacterium]|nr:hypothetical protein [Verrucomicrobiae bacterium]